MRPPARARLCLRADGWWAECSWVSSISRKRCSSNGFPRTAGSPSSSSGAAAPVNGSLRGGMGLFQKAVKASEIWLSLSSAARSSCGNSGCGRLGLPGRGGVRWKMGVQSRAQLCVQVAPRGRLGSSAPAPAASLEASVETQPGWSRSPPGRLWTSRQRSLERPSPVHGEASLMREASLMGKASLMARSQPLGKAASWAKPSSWIKPSSWAKPSSWVKPASWVKSASCVKLASWVKPISPPDRSPSRTRSLLRFPPAA